MRSKTSFFNATLFWKNVRRFWPLWTGYLALWFLILPLPILSGSYAGREISLRYTIYSTGIYGGVLIGLVMGCFSAMAMWGYLYSPRSAHGIACLPVRREGVFVTNLAAGLAPILAANAVTALLTKLAALGAGYAVPGAVAAWFGLVSLTGFFFYCFATLCAQLTGHILVLPAVYGILNFVAIGAEFLIRTICGAFVYGMMPGLSEDMTLRWFSPVIGYMTAVEAKYRYPTVLEEMDVRVPNGATVQGWNVVIVYALIGLLFLAAALLLYRSRRMESAGDVVAVKPLKPVFRWCMAIGAGMAFTTLMYGILFDWGGRPQKNTVFLTLLAFFLAGAFIGWFAAEMLMKKSFRVFRGKSWAGLGICCLVIILFMGGMRLDFFGYESRIPDTEQIASVTVIGGGTNTVLEEPESIELVRAFHREVIASKDYNENYGPYSVDCRIIYTLKNGGTASRYYVLRYAADENGVLLPEDQGNASALNAVLNTPEGILSRKRSPISLTRDTLYSGTVSAVMTAPECAAASGYDDVEEYILREREGWTEARFRAVEPEERRLAVAEAILNQAINGEELLWEAAGVSEEERYTFKIGMIFTAQVEDLAEHLDFDRVYFDYSYELDMDRAGLWELYSECVLPDLREGTLGKVWAVTDQEYRNSVYQVRINLDFREKREGQGSAYESYDGYEYAVPATTDGYNYFHFYTVPTTASARTDAWLRAHGVALYTQAETDVVRYIQ